MVRHRQVLVLAFLANITAGQYSTAFLFERNPQKVYLPTVNQRWVAKRSPALATETISSSVLSLAASSSSSTTAATPNPNKPKVNLLQDDIGPVLDDIPSQFQPLFASAINATSLRGADTSNQGHDSFRYEWGTWVNESNLEYLMEQVDTVRLQRGSYDNLILQSTDAVTGADENDQQQQQAFKYKVGSGTDWDCWLHVLPPNTFWQGRQPTGAWSVLKCLTGLTEISALQQTRDGDYKPKTKRELMGGSDGSLGGGMTESSAGEPCIKYVGGPLRRYSGKYGKTTLLEVVVRPPIGKIDANAAKTVTAEESAEEIFELSNLEDALSIAEPDAESSGKDVVAQEESDGSAAATAKRLGEKIGMNLQEQVGGLDVQLNAIARRVLASRANPATAKKLGVSHVRGILLSGPPGCGKTLMARELSRLLGAREPQIVNGPEILDKYIGEAEKKVRDLFAPAEREYKVAGDASALHVIILDEMDAIARKRGTMTSDTTGVRDSVVNQLLAKMDGVQQAPNILVVGLTNRPELLDPALLRPGRLEVQLRVELPDLLGRRDILKIHTRQMREAQAVSKDAITLIEDVGEEGLAARTEHFSGAELAGLVRSAASFALARALEADADGIVTTLDFEKALNEVRPALGKQDETLRMRYPFGISPCSSPMKRIMRDLERFTAPIPSKTPQVQSLLLVGAGGNGGAGVTALGAWAAAQSSALGRSDYVRLITALDLIVEGSGGDEARAAALVERFAEAREMPNSMLVLDDVDQLCAGSGSNGYSSVMIATLRALLRSPPASTSVAKAGGQSESKRVDGNRVMHVIAATSRSDAACNTLQDVFDETIVVPLLEDVSSIETLLADSLGSAVHDPKLMAEAMIERLGKIGCKTALRLAERAISSALGREQEEITQVSALSEILEDLIGDEVTATQLCEVL